MKSKLLLVIAIETVLLIVFIIYAVSKNDRSVSSVDLTSSELNTAGVVSSGGGSEIEEYKMIAAEARNEADKQRERADENERAAIAAKTEADVHRARSIQNEKMALAAKAEAELQRLIAIENEKKAMEMQRLAETQRRLAVANEAAAAKQIKELTAELERLKKGNQK